MKRIIYEYIQKVDSNSEPENDIPNLVTNWIECAESDFEINYAKAQQESYNGDVTIEDIPDEPQEPTTEQRISDLEEQIIQADETAIALYEAQEAQETINAQQDEALMEIYEMIG